MATQKLNFDRAISGDIDLARRIIFEYAAYFTNCMGGQPNMHVQSIMVYITGLQLFLKCCQSLF